MLKDKCLLSKINTFFIIRLWANWCKHISRWWKVLSPTMKRMISIFILEIFRGGKSWERERVRERERERERWTKLIRQIGLLWVLWQIKHSRLFNIKFCLLALWVECSAMVRETWVQSQVASYQRLEKWYLIPPCLTLSNIKYVSRVKWSNPGKGVAPSPTPGYSSYWKGSLLVALDYGHQQQQLIYWT